MPISIIDNFDVNAAKNIDGRLGPYDTTASAKAAIDETTQRYLGLTVVVTGSGNLEEYWFQDGVTDSDLVLKPGGSSTQTGSFMVTGSATDNILTFTKGDGSTFDLIVNTGSSGAGTLQEVLDAGSIGSASGDMLIKQGDRQIYFDQTDESIYLNSTGSAGMGGVFLTAKNTAINHSASIDVVEGTINFKGTDLGSPTPGDVLVARTVNGGIKWTGSSAVGGGGTDPKYLVYQTGSGTDSIKPSHGNGNVSSGTRSTVVGGANNEATQTSTFVGGGEENCALQTKTAVLGGEKNKACQGYTVAGGGYLNTANGCLSGVWSGCVNTAGGNSSAILGGRNNEASGDCSIVVGGQLNCAQKTHDFIGGGCNNQTAGTGVSSFNSILGGELNEILDELGNSTSHSTIGGGECNQIDADHAVIGGGCKNYIGGVALNPEASTIGGGHNNFISSSASTIAGGEGNHINEQSECSFIGGGHQNIISLLANTSTIGGGTQNNIAEGSCCGGILGGQRNKLQHDKSFIIGSELTSSAACTTFMNNATLEGNISASATGSFGYIVLDYDNMPTSDPNVKGAIYRSGTTILISAG